MDNSNSDSQEASKSSKPNLILYAALGLLVIIAGASYLSTNKSNPSEQSSLPTSNTTHSAEPAVVSKTEVTSTTPKESKADLEKQAARRDAELAEQRREAEHRRQQSDREAEAKIAADRERQRQQQETQQRALDEQEKVRRADAENARRNAAESKVKQSRAQVESQLRKTSNDISNVDADYVKAAELQATARSKSEKSNAKATTLLEKSRGSATAARNQIAFNQKKIQEANLQLQTYQRNPKTSKDALAQLQQKQAGYQKEITTLQAALTKAEADQTAAQNELNKSDPEMSKSDQAMTALARKRSALAQTLEGQIVEMERLRQEPDYVEMTKKDGDFDTQKLIDGARQLLAKNIEDAVSSTKSTANSLGTDRKVPADPDIVVSNQKTTLYTLKNGRKISSVKSMDAGDSISVKTLGGKFETIQKEDIAKEEVLE